MRDRWCVCTSLSLNHGVSTALYVASNLDLDHVLALPCRLLELSIHHELYLSENKREQAGSSHSNQKVRAWGSVFLNMQI